MAFEPIINRTGGGDRISKPKIIVGFQKDRVVTFYCNREIINMMSWNTGDRILVQCGYGADLGKIILRKVQFGGQKLSVTFKSRNCFTVVFRVLPMVGNMTRVEYFEALKSAGRQVTFHDDNGDLIISMPVMAAKPALEVVR